MRLPKRTHSTSNKRKQESLEPRRWLIKALLQRLEEMYVELLSLLDILTHTLENDVLHEDLGDLWCGGDEDLGRFVAGVWSPFVWAGELDDLFPVWDGWEDLEWLWELARLVSRE